jgi:hypothetical protein
MANGLVSLADPVNVVAVVYLAIPGNAKRLSLPGGFQVT